uniref:Uncharacterized protein n=1 Tax=Amphimedon queenslandica TaxID=400682 RepID=A0A1X7UV55_AMPQE
MASIFYVSGIYMHVFILLCYKVTEMFN